MRSALLTEIATNPALWPEGAPPRSPEVMLLVRQGFRCGGRQRVTWLVFERDATRPFLVARHFASPAWNGAVIDEHAFLSRLARSSCGSLVPVPLATATIGSRAVLFERASPGLPLPRAWDGVCRTDPQRAPLVLGEHFALASQVIGRLDSTSLPAPAGGVQEAVGRLEQRVARLAEQHPLALDLAAASDGFARAVGLFADLPNPRLRTVHGDFVPANLLQWPQGVHLIDWEYRVDASPLWPFEALKFTYFELWECCRRGLLGLPSDHRSAFRLFVEGRAGAFQEQADRFFDSLGLPCQEAESRSALWAFFFLAEIALMTEVADLVYWRPLVDELSWVLDPAARRVVAPDGGAASPQGEAPATADGGRSSAAVESEAPAADREALVAELAEAVAERDALRSESAEATQCIAALAAERDAARTTLETFQRSRLWQLGSVYWRLRKLLGSVPLIRALRGRQRSTGE